MAIRYEELRLAILEAEETTFALTPADGIFNVLGNDLANTITGNAFDNVLNGGAGADKLLGGAGNDTYVVDNVGDIASEVDPLIDTAGSVDPGGIDLVRSSITWTLGAFLENLTLTGEGDINGTGNALANTILGNAGANVIDGAGGNDSLFGAGGADQLIGGGGDDSLDGGNGADQMAGGTGNDFYVVDNLGDVITEVVEGGGIDTVSASLTYSIAAQAGLENIVLTGTAAINATGNTGNNSLTGNAAVNELVGGAGNDILDGGAGADRLDGGSGNDTYVIDNAGDVIIDSDGVDTVVSFLSDYTLALGLENAQAGGTNAINLTGNSGNNVLTGNAAANILNGGAGADSMSGGAGDDTYIVDNSLDVVTEAAGGGQDTVRTSVNFSLAVSAEVEFLTAATNGGVRLTGSDTANVITGGNGRDVLLGLGGDDLLDGGRGRDDLRGGAGEDIFRFDERPTRSTTDRILDFDARFDTIQLDNDFFSGLGRGTEANPGRLSSSVFRIGTSAQDANDRIIYNPITDDLLYDRDGSGGAAAVKIADLNNLPRSGWLSARDFEII